MKKIFAIILTIILTITYICPIVVYATDEDYTLLIDRNVPMDKSTCPAPILTYHETEQGNYITCTYRPDAVNRFLLSPTTQALNNVPQNWSTHISIDFKIDNNPWLSELEFLDNATANMFTVDHIIDTPIDKNVTLLFLDLRQYNEMDDVNNIYQGVIEQKNEQYAINLNNHTITARFNVKILFSNGSLSIPHSTEYTLHHAEDSQQITLPAPQIHDVKMRLQQDVLSYQLIGDSQVYSLIDNKHNVYTLVKYFINGTEAQQQTQPITQDIYTSFQMTTKVMQDDTMTLQIAYHDATTNTTSKWATYEVEIIDSASPEFIMPPLQGDNAENSTQIQTEHKCGLCGICPAQPLNICLWMWGCMSVAAIAIVACVISIIVDLKKKKS